MSTPEELDEALADSFPASDPPSQTSPTAVGPTVTYAHPARVEVCLWRVVDASERDAPFQGACERDGRWTTAGRAVVYASGTPAGAVLEYLAHRPPQGPTDLWLARAVAPGQLALTPGGLPDDWCGLPYRVDVQAIGDAWAEARDSLILEVPGALAPDTFNYLVSTMHEDARRIDVREVIPLPLDPRLS